MANFAKLFQVNPMNQVLLTIQLDPATGRNHIVQYTEVGERQFAIDVEFPLEDSAFIAFDQYTQEKAEIFWDEMVKYIEAGHSDRPSEGGAEKVEL